MKAIKSQTGSSQIILMVVAAVIVIGGATWYLMDSSKKNAQVLEMQKDINQTDDDAEQMIDTATSSDEVMMEEKADDGVMMEDKEEVMMKPDTSTMIKYSGTVLAGTQAKVLDFNQADYEAAKKANKTILLYFYANWCPLCIAEVPSMYQAFNSLQTDQIVAFRVSFNDNETNAYETGLAREFGVAYQHTKVIIKNGQRILKSPESWNQTRYMTEINLALSNS